MVRDARMGVRMKNHRDIWHMWFFFLIGNRKQSNFTNQHVVEMSSRIALREPGYLWDPFWGQLANSRLKQYWILGVQMRTYIIS